MTGFVRFSCDRLMDAPDKPPIRGWLLVLCGCLGVWQPLHVAGAAASALQAIPNRGWPLVLLLLVRLLATALGVSAAVALVGHHGGAVRLAHLALFLWMAVELFVYGTSIFPNNRMPGDTPLYVAATLIYSIVWSVYLWRSARVRHTYQGS